MLIIASWNINSVRLRVDLVTKFLKLADPDIIPKSIYVSTCCTAPLGVDFEFLLKNDKDDFQLGIDVLNTLVKKPINLSIDAYFSGFF